MIEPNPVGMPDHVRFNIPVSVDKFGWTEHKTVVVSRLMLPIMAQIVENATRPRLLTQRYELHGEAVRIGGAVLESIRERVQYDLEHGLREEAKKQGLAVITAVTFDEQKMIDEGILFRAQATGMPLLDTGIQR